MTSKKPEDVGSRKGIHDPWRLGTSEWEPEDAPTGAVGSSDEFDWDLAPDRWFVFRVHGAALKIMDARDPVEAALRLLKAYREDTKIQEVMAAAGFVDMGDQDIRTGFVFRTPAGILCCPEAESIDDGLQRLVKALRAAVRDDKTMKQRLSHLGIIPLVE